MSNVLVDYLTAACAGTGQSTFYNTRTEQLKALEDVHGRMSQDNRRIYALSAALPVNDKSRQLILANLLASGKHCEDGTLETQVMQMVIEDMQYNRVLNLFVDLRVKKVNNSRTRRLGRIIWEMTNEWRAIKYTSKLRTLLRHCHIAESRSRPARAEMHQFVYGKVDKSSQVPNCPKIQARIDGRTDYSKLFELPYDIAVAMAVCNHGKTADEFKKEFAGTDTKVAKGKVTRKETMRVRQEVAKSSGTKTTVDFSRFELFDLFMHAYRNKNDMTEVLPFIEKAARKVAEGMNLPEKVALVIDNSVSTLGSAERQFQPVSMIASVSEIIKQSDSNVDVFYVGPEPSNGYLMPEGATSLRRPLVEALLTRPDCVFILSDGYENVRAGSVAQILSTKAYKDSDIPVMHLNPVAAVEAGGNTRSLADNMLTFGLSKPEQLPMVTLVGLAAQDPRLLEGMFGEVERCIKLGDFKNARLATRVASLPALV